jgi:hypothetical protein
MVSPSLDQPLAGPSHRFDELFAKALPIAAARLGQHAGASSFLESYLEEALAQALLEIAPGIEVQATGRQRIRVPNWDKELGGFDLRVQLLSEKAGEALIETKIDDIDQTLWDLFKLAAGLTMPGIETGYMVLARHSHRWDDGDCSALFAESNEPARWDSAAMFGDWKAAWADLLRGGSARPTSIASEVETAFIGRAQVTGFDSYEVRCVAVRLVPDAGLLQFDGDWPVSNARRG